MIRYVILTLLMIVLVSGCASSRNELVGTWVLVESGGSARYPADPPAAEDLVKVVADKRFSFAAQTAPDEIFGGGGTWRREGDLYVETIRYHSLPALVGATAVFDCRVEDDLWYHSGEFEAGGRRFAISEVWRRVEEQGDR